MCISNVLQAFVKLGHKSIRYAPSFSQWKIRNTQSFSQWKIRNTHKLVIYYLITQIQKHIVLRVAQVFYAKWYLENYFVN